LNFVSGAKVLTSGAVGSNGAVAGSGYVTYTSDTLTALAQTDLTAAITDCSNREGQYLIDDLVSFESGNHVLVPGVYYTNQLTSTTLSTWWTLDANDDPDAFWIFNIPNGLTFDNGGVEAVDKSPIYPAPDGTSPYVNIPVWWNVGSGGVIISGSATVLGQVMSTDIITVQGAPGSIIMSLLSTAQVVFEADAVITAQAATYPNVYAQLPTGELRLFSSCVLFCSVVCSSFLSSFVLLMLVLFCHF
jgi:hypothetical protein